MKVRFYIAPQIGDGSYLNPFRSPITEMIDLTQGGGVSEVDTPARRISICYVLATDIEHATILTNATIVPVSPLMEQVDASTPLNESVTNMSGLDAIKTKLENMGISTEWITANSYRDVIRYIIRLFNLIQRINSLNNANALEIFKRNLGTTVAELPVAVRNAIKTWMQNRGLAIGWITNSTTVREILHFIVTNIGIGKIIIEGVEF